VCVPQVRYIIDATEIWCEIPLDKYLQRTLYSHYKSHCTIKWLVACSLTGVINFCSGAFPGKISDVALTKASGILKTLLIGEEVMADKGFLIRQLLLALGCDLHMPPKRRRNQKQLTKEESELTAFIANLRIHIERIMERIKELRILDQTQKLTRKDLWGSIFFVCAMLCNFSAPMISSK
jgi:hypothetical protein